MQSGWITKVSRLSNAAVAGTTDITSGTALDMQGWDGVLFIAAVGTLTSSQVTKLEAVGCATSGGSYAAFTTDAITSAAADGDSNKLLVLDLYRPVTRFVKAYLKRGTANAVLDGIVAIQYRGSKAPFTADTTISQLSAFVSP